MRGRNRYNNSLLSWRILAIAGLMIWAGYYAQRALFGPNDNAVTPLRSDTFSPSATGFIHTCNATLWHVSPTLNLDYQGLYDNKIMMVLDRSSQHDRTSKRLLIKTAKKVAEALDQLRHSATCDNDCDYINFVLAHPDFKLKIEKEQQSDAYGIYRLTQHAIVLTTSILDRKNNELVRTLLHEFWHAYKTMVHTKNINPTTMQLSPQSAPSTPFLRDASDATERQRQVQSAIDMGDRRIIELLPRLLKQESKQTLSVESKKILEDYKAAIATYFPEYYSGNVNANNWRPIAAKVKQAIDAGELYKFTFIRDKHEIVMYVEEFKLNDDGGAQLKGFRTPNVNDKMTAFINDALHRIFNLPYMDRKQNYSPMGTVELSVLTERDAHIAQYGEIIRNAFYPELVDFHRCEHNEAFGNKAKLPASKII